MAERVVLFIDYQNVYQGARRCFERSGAFHTAGQIDPVALGELLSARAPQGTTRDLLEVRLYTGRPDSTKQPRAYAAHMRQCAVWARSGVAVVPRALRYPPNWPGSPAQEKGIDVQLAIDVVAGAIDNTYDVGIIFSTDTDLRPALEFVSTRFHNPFPRVETAAWRATGASRALTATSRRRTWVHYLSRVDYERVHDARDFNVPQ